MKRKWTLCLLMAAFGILSNGVVAQEASPTTTGTKKEKNAYNPIQNEKNLPEKVRRIEEIVDKYIKDGHNVRRKSIHDKILKEVSLTVARLDTSKQPDTRTRSEFTKMALRELAKELPDKIDVFREKEKQRLLREVKLFKQGDRIKIKYTNNNRIFEKEGRYNGYNPNTHCVSIDVESIRLVELVKEDRVRVTKEEYAQYIKETTEENTQAYAEKRKKILNDHLMLFLLRQKRLNEKLGYIAIKNTWYTPNELVDYIIATKPQYVPPSQKEKVIDFSKMTPEQAEKVKKDLLVKRVQLMREEWSLDLADSVDCWCGPDSLAWDLNMKEIQQLIPESGNVMGQMIIFNNFNDPIAQRKCKLTLSFRSQKIRSFNKEFPPMEHKEIDAFYKKLVQLQGLPKEGEFTPMTDPKATWEGKRVRFIFNITPKTPTQSVVTINCVRLNNE